MTVSPGGKWAYLTHNLARAMIPTAHIEFGWINANALTTVDLTQQALYATIQLLSGLADLLHLSFERP